MSVERLSSEQASDGWWGLSDEAVREVLWQSGYVRWANWARWSYDRSKWTAWHLTELGDSNAPGGSEVIRFRWGGSGNPGPVAFNPGPVACGRGPSSGAYMEELKASLPLEEGDVIVTPSPFADYEDLELVVMLRICAGCVHELKLRLQERLRTEIGADRDNDYLFVTSHEESLLRWLEGRKTWAKTWFPGDP